MSEKPSDNIGKRVAFYRKLNGWSAADLSERTHGAVSKGVIANIETGRKRDLTVDELISLSWALGVPPVALALPIDTPNAMVKVSEGKTALHSVSVAIAARQFVSPALPWRSDYPHTSESGSPAGALSTSRVNSLFQWWASLTELWSYRRKLKDAEHERQRDLVEKYDALIREASADVGENERQMRTFGMTLDSDG